MSLAEELLATIGEEATVHEHPVSDHDHRFVIDPDSKEITSVSPVPHTIVQRDHLSEVYTIELPRLVEGHDMTLCNRVRVHFNNIDGETGAENADVAELDRPVVDPEDPSKVIVIWNIRREATQLAGILAFAVQYMCVAADGTVTYEFHTDDYSDVEVKRFKDNGEPSVIKYSNILEDWYQKIFGLEDSLIANVNAEAEAQKEAIRLKGEATLASIPEDYTTVSNMAEEALRKKANAIEMDVAGEAIFVDDSSDSSLLGLKLYGKTTQVAGPTPDNPQALESVENPTISICGKNLLDISLGLNNCLVDNGDGTYTITKVDEHKRFSATIPIYIPAGVSFVFSLNTIEQTCVQPVQVQIFFSDETTTTLSPDRESVYDKAIVGARLYISVSDSIGTHGKIKDCQIELGTTVSDYESYKPSQTLAINRTLHGIPVSSGGNYTDSDGRQWICDEIDFERGVHIQRVCQRTFDGVDGEVITLYSERNSVYGFALKITDVNMLKISHVALCTHFENIGTGISSVDKECFLCGAGSATIYVMVSKDRIVEYTIDAFKAWLLENPIAIIFQLATPIETALTAEEIAYYKQLKTYYHNTTVINGQGAHMVVEYNADTKLYVDNLPGASAEQIETAVNKHLTEHPISVETLTDTETGKAYKLAVVNGKLTLVSVEV